MSLRIPWVSPEIVDQILRLGRAEDPNETCGIVTPDSMVVQLPNSSPSPTDSYVITTEDLVSEMDAYIARAGVHPANLTREHFIIWHTHPDHTVGPSKGDLKHRLPGFQYIVITLPDGEATVF